MKRLTLATIATLTIATSASAGVCTWIERVDIPGSVKGSAMLSGGITLATTLNPAVAAVNGVATGAVVGGTLYTVDYTCYVFEKHDVADKTAAIANEAYNKASEYTNKGYTIASEYATDSYNYINNWWNEDAA
jgi:hypothetical protein